MVDQVAENKSEKPSFETAIPNPSPSPSSPPKDPIEPILYQKSIHGDHFFKNRGRIGVDIGGTLIKCAIIVPKSELNEYESEAPPLLVSGTSGTVGGDRYIVFRYFLTSRIEDFFNFVKAHNIFQDQDSILCMTGGGAYRFEQQIKEQIGAVIVRRDEIESSVCGLSLAFESHYVSMSQSFTEQTPRQSSSDIGVDDHCTIYTYDLQTDSIINDPVMKEPNNMADSQSPESTVENRHALPAYPLMLVHIGSGVGFIRVDAPGVFERVSGTCIGGGTVLGMCKLAFGVSSFDEVVKLSAEGSPSLDMTVADLVGEAAHSSTLPSDTLAASFGRVQSILGEIPINNADFAHSAVRMVSYNLGLLGTLLAKLHHCNNLVYAGKYISNHHFTIKTITEAVSFYNITYGYGMDDDDEEDDMCDTEQTFASNAAAMQHCCTNGNYLRAKFLRHDGYLGALGVLSIVL